MFDSATSIDLLVYLGDISSYIKHIRLSQKIIKNTTQVEIFEIVWIDIL